MISNVENRDTIVFAICKTMKFITPTKSKTQIWSIR